MSGIRAFVSEVAPLEPLDTVERIQRSSNSIIGFDAISARDAHVLQYGDLDPNTGKFDECEVRDLLTNYESSLERLRGCEDSRLVAIARAEAKQAAVGPEPFVDQRLSELIGILPKLEDYDRAITEYSNATAAHNNISSTCDIHARRMAIAEKALEIVTGSRSQYVEKSTTEIADSVNVVLARLFDGRARYVMKPDDKDRIDAVLQLYGREDVDLSALSGGEVDRFSIAVATAFARFRGTPMLIFDETISSLDQTRRIECVESVASLLPGRVVIFVAHDLPLGLFNSIINMNDVFMH
jgi:DNA repair exonuclease SbcCD ATPase subunit